MLYIYVFALLHDARQNVKGIMTMLAYKNLHEYEGGIENSVPMSTVWHHEACQSFCKYRLRGMDSCITPSNKKMDSFTCST